MRHGMAMAALLLLAAGGGTARAAPAPAEPERPLGRKVSLEARGLPLEDALAKLAAQGRVRLRAAAHLREKRLTLLVKEEPLGKVMEAVADLWSLPRFPARWRKEKEAEAYELWQHAEAAREGERREKAERERMAGWIWKLRDLKEDGRDGLRHTIEVAPGAGQWSLGWAVTTAGLLRELPREVVAAGLAGREVPVPSRQLPPVSRGLVYRNVAHLHRIGTVRPGASRAEPRFEDLIRETDAERMARFQRETVSFLVGRDERGGRWGVDIRLRGNGETWARGVSGPPIGFLEDLEEAERAARGGKNSAAVPRQPETRLTPAQRKALAEAAKEGVKSMPECQALLHGVLRLPVAADYYCRGRGSDEQVHQRAFAEAAAKSETLEGFLEAYTRPLNYRWRRQGRALVMRSRMWWVEDEREVPLSLARRLVKAWKTRGYLNLEELSLTGGLTDRQLETLGRDYLTEEIGHGIRPIRPWLRLYAALPAGLRARYAGEAGVALGDVPPALLEAVMPAGVGPSAAVGMAAVRERDLPFMLRRLEPEARAAARVRIVQEAAPRRDGKAVMRTRLLMRVPEGRELMLRAMEQLLEEEPPAP